MQSTIGLEIAPGGDGFILLGSLHNHRVRTYIGLDEAHTTCMYVCVCMHVYVCMHAGLYETLKLHTVHGTVSSVSIKKTYT